MLNLSDKELDRFSKEAAQEYEPGDVLGPRSWDKLELRIDQEFGRAGWNFLRHIRRYPFYYAPALLLLLGVSYYFASPGRGISSGSSPGETVKAQTEKTPVLTQIPDYSDTSTSTSTFSSTAAAGAKDAQSKDANATGSGSTATGESNVANEPTAAGADKAGGGSSVGTGPDAGGPAGGRIAGSGASRGGTAGTVSGAAPPATTTNATTAAATTRNRNTTMINGTVNRNSGGKVKQGNRNRNGERGSGLPGENTVAVAVPLHSGQSRSAAAGAGQRQTKEGPARPGEASAARPGEASAARPGEASAARPGGTVPVSPSRELNLSPVQSPHTLGRRRAINDSALRAFTLRSTVPPLVRNKGGLHISRDWQFGLSIAPDFTSVSSLAGDRPGSSIGLTVDYEFANHWYIGTGILATRKNYAARGQDYHLSQSFYQASNINPDAVNFIKGSFTMMEIPLNLRYDFSVSGNTLFFVSGGLSSYLLTNENANLYWERFNIEFCKNLQPPNKSTNLFSAVNLSVGVETGLSNSLSLLIAPYMKLPSRNIGFGQVQMNSVGINFALKFSPITRRRR